MGSALLEFPHILLTVYFNSEHIQCRVFPDGTVVKNLPANAGDAGDPGSIPGSERSPGEGMATHASVLAWEMPWTEESGGLRPWGRRVGHD